MLRSLIALLTLLLVAVTVTAWPPPQGKGPPAGKGPNADPQFAADRETFHFLLEHRAQIRRTVKKLPDGVETVTESDDGKITAKIQEHVKAMHQRVKNGRGIHLRDPLFAELFRHWKDIRMDLTVTEKGMKVVERSENPHVAVMIQAHAEVVSLFLANGHAEVQKNHAVPEPPRRDPTK